MSKLTLPWHKDKDLTVGEFSQALKVWGNTEPDQKRDEFLLIFKTPNGEKFNVRANLIKVEDLPQGGKGMAFNLVPL